MKMIMIYRFLVLLLMVILTSACKKDWLDAKPNKALVVPSNISDYQALLDNTAGTNGMNINQPALSMVADGDYYIADATYNALATTTEKNDYTWAATTDFYGGLTTGDWNNPYAQILQSNIVLDGIQSLNFDSGTQTAYNNVKGSALFFRSYEFFNLSQEFCSAYDAITSNTDLGLPLRLSSNINLVLPRASVQQTYDQIIHDIKQAIPLLPATPLYPTRPSKPAAYGLLARVYLSEANYNSALLYADSCLQLQNTLMDFNQLLPSATNPIAQFNSEVVFHTRLISYTSTNAPKLIVDPILYQSYASNDLRPAIYFINSSGVITIHGAYGGSSFNLFGGIATDEMYLTRAEGYARAGNLTSAMNDLNTLLKNRWKTGTFANLTAANADAALILILSERRKELVYRNLRWTDLRRLNKESRFQVTLTRTVNGQVYTLPPNSPKYVFPLDNKEITLSGLPQNPR